MAEKYKMNKNNYKQCSYEELNKSPVARWFGEEFSLLHPLLQQLHMENSRLKGKVIIEFGIGIAGFIGKRLANSLNIPTNYQECELIVDISHHNELVYWTREFRTNEQIYLTPSIFSLQGTKKRRGYWIEKTGLINLVLDVDVIDNGWHWKTQRVRIKNTDLPLFLFPQVKAYKQIVDDKYIFSVSFYFPGFGKALSYFGELEKI